VTVAKPPPPPPGGTPPGPNAPPPGAACPRLTGPVAPRGDVAAAMSAAAGRSYRPTLSLDDNNPPAINVRLLLVQGIGWEESGWQSTIESCDGGLGTMQVMTDTATWMNQKYGTNNDRASLTGNINIATGYLAWLTRYFGDKYFSGNYSLAGDPNKIVLLDMVISAYQAGFGKVDNAMAAGQDLPNRWYVDTVEGFMTHTPWTASPSPSAS
jgi:soluble lytic murein transglycosylase-like protein